MSVYIKGMEMPISCDDCYFLGECGICSALLATPHTISECVVGPWRNIEQERPPFCPLIPVPEHGRLIDADALEKEAQLRLLICNKNNNQFQKPYEVMRAIALASTIIPADKEGE